MFNRQLATACLLAVGFIHSAHAQSTFGAFIGTVKDSSGALVGKLLRERLSCALLVAHRRSLAAALPQR